MKLQETDMTIAWDNYQRMRVQLAGRINRELSRETGLSEADYEILTHLIDSPNASMRAMALRCGIEWEKSRLSHQLRRMEQRGLVVREECVEDNRGTEIRITDEGRELAELGKRHHDEAIRRYVFDVLTPEQLDALGSISETILAQFETNNHAHTRL
jgi:DNA-binding MarR family transcriptional regulator